MTKIFNLFFTFSLFFSPELLGQSPRRCAVGTNITEDEILKYHKIQRIIDSYNSHNLTGNTSKISSEVIRIPVVVHVIRNRESNSIEDTNISDQQVFSQIKVLNEDFNRIEGTNGYNNSSVGADMQIEFVLATSDPNGFPSSGINRVYYPKNSFNINDGSPDIPLLCSQSYWDSEKYLNIWVANLSDGFLGRSEFPGADYDGLSVEDPPKNIDGVIISYKAFGSQIGTSTSGLYSYGRTTTHEVGHWLGLIHTWGDEFCGTDFVEDTPQTENPNLGSTCNDLFSYCQGKKTQNMIENYLDYSPDLCMNIFTIGQKNRTRAILKLSEARKKLVENSLLIKTISDFSVKIISNPSTKLRVQILLPEIGDFKIKIFTNEGFKVYEKDFIHYPTTIFELDKKELGTGLFFLDVENGKNKIRKRIIVF